MMAARKVIRVKAAVVALVALSAGCVAESGAEDGTIESAAATPQEEARPEDTEVWDPEPGIVAPGEASAPPSDAVVLFDGTDLS
ncbi:MAG: hypothetical protein ABGY41_08565, partial [Candidatus Poribacteria bacterium]